METPESERNAGMQNSVQLADYLNELLKNNKPECALTLVKSTEGQILLTNDCSDAISNVVKYLTNENFIQNAKLYNGCEEMLKSIAGVGNEGEVILELLEVIDTTKNDNTVVSILKALQVCLLRQREQRVRSLEWCLNSIQLYVSDLPLAHELRQRMDNDDEKFLEEDDEVRRIISFYFYLFLFYEPILEHIIVDSPACQMNYKIYGITRRNVMACFIIQLFNEPFAILEFGDLNSNDKKEKRIISNNTYSRQCATSLVKHILMLFPDPFQLISYGEHRIRWPYMLPESDDSIMNAAPPENIYLIEEKAPMTGLSVMFYAMIGENLLPDSVPKIYRNVYLFEMGLYYVTDLLATNEDSLHSKGIRLALELLKRLDDEKLQDDTLDLDVHKTFLMNLTKVLDTTQVRRNSKYGVELLKSYLMQFNSIEAKHYHIKRLIQTVDNNKICGFLVTIYKNIIADQLNDTSSDPTQSISQFCSGAELKSLLLENICVIPNGVETDILQQNDLILAALNMLRFLVLRDHNNQTQIWDYIDQINDTFMKPLREALDCSRAHYKLEEKRINDKNGAEIECKISTAGAEDFLGMSKKNRLQVLTIGHNTFDLIDSLMSRLTECIDMRQKQ